MKQYFNFIRVALLLRIQDHQMSLCRLIRIDTHSAYLLWLTNESEEDLLNKVGLTALEREAYSKVTHPRKRLDWLAARLALKQLCSELNYAYTELYKDSWGRPYLADSKFHISLAHCFPFALAAVAKQAPIGIDIQLPHKKLQKVQEKYLNDAEIKDSADDLEKLCIYWCAKEAIYKAYGGAGLSLRQDISIEPFVKSNQGTVRGNVDANRYTLHYSLYSGYVLAYCQPAK